MSEGHTQINMLEKISLDTIEELSNGFLNKIVEIKDKLQGKDDESEQQDREESQPDHNINEEDMKMEDVTHEEEPGSSSYFSFTGLFMSKEVHYFRYLCLTHNHIEYMTCLGSK